MTYPVKFDEIVTTHKRDIALGNYIIGGERTRVEPSVSFRVLPKNARRIGYSESAQMYFFINNKPGEEGLYYCESLVPGVPPGNPETPVTKLTTLTTTERFIDLSVYRDTIVVASEDNIWISTDCGKTFITATSMLEQDNKYRCVTIYSNSLVLVGTMIGILYLYDGESDSSTKLYTPAILYETYKITFSKTNEYFLCVFIGASHLIYGKNTGTTPTIYELDLTTNIETTEDTTVDTITTPTLIDACMYSGKSVYFTVIQDSKQYYASIASLTGIAIRYYDLDNPTIGETYITCFPYGADYYSSKGIPIFVNEFQYKVLGESRWRELPILAGFVNVVSNKFVQITSTSEEEEVCVSENVLHITSGTDERHGIPPEKVFVNYEEDDERVQLRGVAEGDNSIAIESGALGVEENSVIIGKVTNNIVQLGQLEFVVLEDKLVVKSRATKKSFDLLYQEAPGPS
jgi:hypothetical protein